MAFEFNTLISDAFKFATPFAQNLLGQSSTPKAVQTETLKNASLNGSGPNDPSLAKQAPLGLMDFITGNSGGDAGGKSVSNGLKMAGGMSWGIIAVVVVAIVGLVLIIRK